jgi:hypothetical protein
MLSIFSRSDISFSFESNYFFDPVVFPSLFVPDELLFFEAFGFSVFDDVFFCTFDFVFAFDLVVFFAARGFGSALGGSEGSTGATVGIGETGEAGESDGDV